MESGLLQRVGRDSLNEGIIEELRKNENILEVLVLRGIDRGRPSEGILTRIFGG